MAYTLVDAAKLSNDVLQAGVIELLAKDDPIFDRLKFVDILGNGLTYNVETAMATAGFYDVGDTWTEDTPTTTPATATLKILGGDAEVDNYLKKTRSNVNDLTQEAIAGKVKAVKWEFMDSLIYGTATSTKGFNGLHTLLTSTTYNTVHAGATTGTALSMDKLKQAIDLVKGTTPQLIVSSKKVARLVETYLESLGAYKMAADEFGRRLMIYRNIPWATCDFILDTETASSGAYAAKTGGSNSSIFVLSFEAPKGLVGLQQEPIQIKQVTDEMETKDASLYRIKWYVSVMLQSIITCSKVDGILTTGAVTA